MRYEDPTALSRRQLLAAGLVAGAGLLASTRPGLARTLRRDDEPETGPYGPFKMGIQSYSLRHFGLDVALDKSKELGLKYWESFPAHIPIDLETAEDHRRKAEDFGVQVIGFGVIAFTNDHDANRRIFDFGKALGVEYFSADPEPDAFDSLDRCVEESGIAVGIHNHGPGHRYGPISVIRDAIKDHHEKIGCCVDTGHFLRSGEDPVEAVEVFKDRVFGVHLKDVKGTDTFTLLGEGDLKTEALLKALAEQKYRYCLALEYEENPESPMDDIRACLAAARKAAPTGR